MRTLCRSIFLLLVLVIISGQVIEEENEQKTTTTTDYTTKTKTQHTCDAIDGTCRSNDDEAKAAEGDSDINSAVMYRRNLPDSYCSGSETIKDLYRHGGTAQAYKPGTGISSGVCSDNLSKESRYKVASWPFTRRASSGTSPILDLTLSVYGCTESDTNNGNLTCDCSPLVSSTAVVEVWQTRPDGLYGSPRNIQNNDDDECRATIPVDPHTGEAHFSTVAPGSTGIMGGLGPRSRDYGPYGPPVIHILVTTPPTTTRETDNEDEVYAALLLDLPFLIHPKTLEPRSFSLSAFDWRGQAWSRRQQPKGSVPPFNITSWKVNDEKRIDIEIDVFLERIEQPSAVVDPEFCPSFTYILPGAFFLEPISVCANSVLDFFPV